MYRYQGHHECALDAVRLWVRVHELMPINKSKYLGIYIKGLEQDSIIVQ